MQNFSPPAIASEFFETAHTNSCKILVTFLHAKIYDLSETSESLNRSGKLLVRTVQRVSKRQYNFRLKPANNAGNVT
jgi:hypothetical protein